MPRSAACTRLSGTQSRTVWALTPSLAPRLERRRRDGEVLDREPGRVKQRHRLRPGPPASVAREHCAKLADAIPAHETGLDRARQLAAV